MNPLWVGITDVVMVMVAIPIALWIAGAIYFDAANGGRRGFLLAASWVAGVAGLFTFWQPLWQPFAGLLLIFAGFLIWWFQLKPSHDRKWDPAVALMPRASVVEDTITIENVRNSEYRTPEDVAHRYETRTVHLSQLKGVDIIFFNWGSSLMSHPVLVFDFGPDGRVCVSIEVRYRHGQAFSILRSLYRQQELIYVVADERDVILRRTKAARPQVAHLYNMRSDPEELKSVFLDYIGTINELFEMPRWYHGVCENCTTSFYRLPNRRLRLDWRVLANARLDRALYEAGKLDRSLPFDELRRLALVNEIANAAPEIGFGDHIRRELEDRRRGKRDPDAPEVA